MVFAVEITTATLALLVVAGVVVGFIIGLLVRPWLFADRLREDYEAALEATRAELAACSEARTAAEDEVAKATTELETARADVIRLTADLDAATRRVAELEAQLETLGLEKDAEIERLGAEAAEVGSLRQRVAELEASPSGPPSEPAAAAPDPDTARAHVAEIARRTRGDAARVDDDLERVHGIGPKIAGLLRDMDITSFRQIARFQGEDIAYVAVALESFPDRIVRDGWMSSAAALHREKYREDV